MPHPNDNLHYAAIVASSTDAIVSKTLDGVVTSWNPAAETLFGYNAAEMIGSSILKLFPPGRLNEEAELIAQIREGKIVEHFRTVRIRKDGSKINISVTLSPIKDQDGEIIGVSKIARDISRQLELEFRAQYHQAIVDNSDDAIISKNLNGIVQSWNRGAQLLFGYTAEEMLNNHITTIVPENAGGEEIFIVSQIKKGVKVDHYFTQRKTKDNRLLDVSISASPIKDHSGAIIGISSICRDVTIQRQAEQIIKKLSERDSLTNLLNRHSFVNRLREQINISGAASSPFAVLYMDLDRFKNINDKLGHDFGDKVLCHLANVITSAVHDDDCVSRIGGDEFLVLLKEIDSTGALIVAKRILKRLHQPFDVDKTTNVISASIGIAMFPSHGTSPQELITHADHALYESKHSGRNTCVMYNKDLDGALSRNQLIASELPKAILAGQLCVYYQPIINMRSEKVTKAEALLRWQHPELGFVSPAEFIPIAEDNGCINDIGQWVFEQVTMQLGKWTQQFDANFKVSINKSPVQFQTDDHAPKHWQEALKKASVSSNNLVVEITEGCLMKSTNVTESKLRGFSGLGFELAIDDFGTGYSSLAYINKFHLDYLKIDRSFVSKIETHPDQHDVCEGIILLAHKLGLKVIAEGIETQGQHALLKKMGCDYGQGYWYSRPVAPNAFENFMLRVQQYYEQYDTGDWYDNQPDTAAFEEMPNIIKADFRQHISSEKKGERK